MNRIKIDGTNCTCWAEYEDENLRMKYEGTGVYETDSEGRCAFLPVSFHPYSLVVMDSDNTGTEYYAVFEDGKPVVKWYDWWF